MDRTTANLAVTYDRDKYIFLRAHEMRSGGALTQFMARTHTFLRPYETQ